MLSPFEKLTIIQKFLAILTWRKISQLSVFLFVLLVAWATYENRQTIYNFANKHKIIRPSPSKKELSQNTIAKIDMSVSRSDIIIGIQVTYIDFHRNTRNIIYTSVDHPEVKRIYRQFREDLISNLPLFNADATNNERVIALIDGNFICNPYSETIGARISPESKKYIHSVCAVGIPPFYGRVIGIVSIYLKEQPTMEELDQIRNLARIISVEVYEKEIR